MTMTRDERWKRRQAVQLAAQLPDDPADAIEVLRYAQEFVETFLADGGKPEGRTVRLVQP
jgi:hypothetical protein